LLRLLLDEADHPSALLTPRIASELVDAFLCALVTHLPHDRSHLFARKVRPAEPAHQRRVEEYLAAHTSKPITLAELATVLESAAAPFKPASVPARR
jgi:hypothetical protein